MPLYLPSESVDQGSYVQLTCIATAGDLPLDFSWSVDGRRVDSATRVSPQTSLFILSSVGLHQAGNYSCHVNNTAGRSTSSVQVKVNGKQIKESNEFGVQGAGLIEIRHLHQTNRAGDNKISIHLD